MIEIQFENKLHQGQQDIWDGFVLDDSIYGCVLNKGRQVGGTTLAKRAALHWAINQPECEIGWLAPEKKNFIKIFNWFKSMDKDIVKSTDGQNNFIYFSNGSVLSFFVVSNYDGIRGSTFDFRIIDEYAFGKFGVEDAIEAYDATMLVKGKKDLIISTPKGKNHHFQTFQEALLLDDWFTYEMKSKDNPMVKKSWLEKKRKELPEHIYLQEYEGKFVDDGGEVFSNFKEACCVTNFKEDYAEPCFMGVDPALGGEDFTTVVILSQMGETLLIKRWREGNTSKQIGMILELMSKFNVVRGLVEVNAERGIQQAISKAKPLIKGWHTTSKNKPDAVQNLKKDIEDGIVKLPTMKLDPICYGEFQTYSCEIMPSGYVRYSHVKGGHDDTVDAYWLANEARIPNRHKRFSPKFAHFSPRSSRAMSFA